MKYMKKLSSKLLLALGVMVLGIIVWQVIVSKRVIGDAGKIREVQSIAQIQELLTNGELKSYGTVPCLPFSKIKIDGVFVWILKGNEYKVYVSDYDKRRMEVTNYGDELVINPLNTEDLVQHIPVFIFMPEDPQTVYFPHSGISWGERSQRIHGFSGENTLLSCEGGYVTIHTDMPYVNLTQKNGSLNINTLGLGSTFSNNSFQFNVFAENSTLCFNDEISDSININMQLQESFVEKLKINADSKLGTLNLQGSLSTNDESHYDKRDNIKIEYPGSCDSLMIQLTSTPGNAKQLFLSKELFGRFEDIHCSENVVIVRE